MKRQVYFGSISLLRGCACFQDIKVDIELLPYFTHEEALCNARYYPVWLMVVQIEEAVGGM